MIQMGTMTMGRTWISPTASKDFMRDKSTSPLAQSPAWLQRAVQRQTQFQESLEDSREKFKKKDAAQVKPTSAEDLIIAAEIKRLKMWEDHVVQHENLHMLTGGEFAGKPQYTYTMGPDGKRYIVGGEVRMYPPAGTTQEEADASLERVKQAAMAPADPSPQDLKTAAIASAQQAALKTKMARAKMMESYEKAKSMDDQIKEKKGEYIDPLKKMKYLEIKSFELFI